MTETAPYPFTQPQNLIPQGVTFPMVLCTTAERLQEILNAIKIAEIYTENSIDSKVDILEALAFLDNPQDAPCFPPCDGCDEDTLSDTVFGFIDEIITNVQTGGISQAVGYVIDTLGSVLVETAIRVIAVTAVGVATAGILTVLVGGVSVGTVAIGAGEVVETILSLPTTTPTNIIEFVFDAVA